ncbi:MAG: arsenate reductase ArsC [Thermoanaerobaculaceae bacterium]|nr:arsenate reductase ArsC [Thermoanaerobaculaceae bacterium]
MTSTPLSDPGPRTPDPARRRRVLVLCTGNSCRSQMAEGWVNHLIGDRWEAHSAGTLPAAMVNPNAVRVMAEVGVDISDHRPKLAADLTGQPWDLVVTVCDHAREVCPFFPHPGEQIHVGFPDPVAAVGTEEEVLAVYRQVRDDIRERLISEVARRG